MRYSSRYKQARELLKIAPQIEAEATQLNRDYEINKRNYEDLVKRRETAELSGDLDSATGGVDFRLIDPPRVSDKPVSPQPLDSCAFGNGRGHCFRLSCGFWGKPTSSCLSQRQRIACEV